MKRRKEKGNEEKKKVLVHLHWLARTFIPLPLML